MNRAMKILDFIKLYNVEKGYSPTYREIGEAVGLQSVSTVSGHLDRMEKRGLIKREYASSRTIQVVTSEPAAESEVKILVNHEDIPTVIAWHGRRYVYADPMG